MYNGRSDAGNGRENALLDPTKQHRTTTLPSVGVAPPDLRSRPCWADPDRKRPVFIVSCSLGLCTLHLRAWLSIHAQPAVFPVAQDSRNDNFIPVVPLLIAPLRFDVVGMFRKRS